MATTELPRPLPGAFLIRVIAPGDEAALEAFYGALSPDSLEARFHGAASVGDKAAHSFCAAEHEGRHGVVAEALDRDGRWIMVGHLCLEPLPDGTAEVALAVADAWQHHGVGRALLLEAIEWARRHDLRALLASVRWTNGPMLRLFRSIGLPITFGDEGGSAVNVKLSVVGTVPHAA